ncbi:hypothetical protein K7X08_030595 [Anisodus acutangulus]|uniref:Uncharacterized protein n=1 Tax=Anisodus acutangulus TaxID=402998 RepID=A0A9Q1MRN7_9SOLA|nr:hypothetical protein K7X08_030595 [Anisodus acutangulus]
MEKVTTDGSGDKNVKKKCKSAVESLDIPCESIPGTIPATSDGVDDTKDEKEDAFAYSGGLHTYCADLDVDDNQSVRGGDENVKDVTSNDGVGGGDSSKETVGGGVGDGVGGGVGVGKGNDSQSDFVFVSDFLDDEIFKYLSKTGITTITQAAKVGVVSTEVVGDEQYIKDGCPENTTVRAVVIEQAREEVLPQGGQLAYEVTAILEDTVKDYGVGPSRASDGDSDSEEEAPNFVIPPVMNLVEINDDQKTHVEPQRGRPR